MMLSRTGALGLLAGAAILGTPLQAQDAGNRPAEPDANDIVVTGRADEPSPAEVNRQAREITEERGDLMYNPLARIEDRLCPGILGLKPEFAALMIDRIRWSGERLDMWMADDTDCSPNLIIAFVEDGQAELQRLAENQGYLFQWMDRKDRDALLAEEGPVRVWTTSMMRASNGMPISRRESLTSPPVMQMNAAHSKIYINVREDIAQTVVLFDREKVRDKTLIQLADYATMRGFAKTRPTSSAATMDTILALFDETGTPPSGLTDFDQAYLRTLYKGIPNIKGMTKINGVDRELRNIREEQAGE
jgi:hypothetical protein